MYFLHTKSFFLFLYSSINPYLYGASFQGYATRASFAGLHGLYPPMLYASFGRRIKRQTPEVRDINFIVTKLSTGFSVNSVDIASTVHVRASGARFPGRWTNLDSTPVSKAINTQVQSMA